MTRSLCRRDLLKCLGALPLAALAPVWAARAQAQRPVHPETAVQRDRLLVLIELHGGNDGLNTVVPYEDALYYRVRPQLAIPRDQVKQVTPRLGLHPALMPMMPMWEGKQLAIVNGVGYPQPNRSHFRSIEIWETGSAGEEWLDSGWLTRLFQQHPVPRDYTAEGIIVGRGDAGPLSGARARTIVLQDPEQFLRQAQTARSDHPSVQNRSLRHILEVQTEILRAAGDLRSRLQEGPDLRTDFPSSRIGKQLEITARLIAAEVPVAVIKVTHGSFDTHVGQLHTHHRLLEELAAAVMAFRSALVGRDLWERVCVMTYSEFGRRVGANGSHGSDHGTAAPQFLFGGRVKGGIYGEYPTLTNLQEGDLRYTVDYRSVYAGIIRGWWGLPDTLFKKQEYEAMDFFR